MRWLEPWKRPHHKHRARQFSRAKARDIRARTADREKVRLARKTRTQFNTITPQT